VRVDALIEKFRDDEPGISGRSKSYLELPSGKVENPLVNDKPIRFRDSVRLVAPHGKVYWTFLKSQALQPVRVARTAHRL